VAPAAQPPVCRIMDYGKFKYERDVRQKEARKKQARVDVKEMKMRPKIDPHDYGTKKGHIVRFLTQGARVKVTIMFRGREMAHTELGRKLLDRLTEDLRELATVDTYPKLDGRNMTMVFAPVKRVPPRVELTNEVRGGPPNEVRAAQEPETDMTRNGPKVEVEAAERDAGVPAGSQVAAPAGSPRSEEEG
jgi:translation initiation factor IF-3